MDQAWATITCKREVTLTEVKGLLCNAFEGGSNYWIWSVKKNLAPGLKPADFQDGGKFQVPGDYWHPFQIIPTVEGCSLCITTAEGKKYTLDIESLKRGLQLMADKCPDHWRDFVTQNDDASTGDVFLQLCLFGEVVYG